MKLQSYLLYFLLGNVLMMSMLWLYIAIIKVYI